MHIISDASLKRAGWTYTRTPGGGFVGYSNGAVAYINWKHIDGPLLYCTNHQLHWLTLWERFRCWIGLDNAQSLDAKHAARHSR
jgi:hypothetical protein